MNISLDLDPVNTVATYGGEQWINGSCKIDNYGIQINDFSIDGIPSETAKVLVVALINHLILNGHYFEFFLDENGEKRLKSS